MIGAIAMSEPAAGSDLQGMQEHGAPAGRRQLPAQRQQDLHHQRLACRPGHRGGQDQPRRRRQGHEPAAGGARHAGLFEKGKRLKKLGLRAQDTSELFFDNVRVPAENLLGGAAMENRGFICLMEQLPWERLQIAITAVAAAQSAIDQTVAYVKERKVFGQAVGAFQNTRYTLAELQTEVQVARVFVDKCCELVCHDKLDTATASMAKYWCSDLQCKVMDECVQLFGGYGYMWEYPITRAYADARVQRIYGGTNEIMKEVISRGMGLGGR
jgi:alkylation response protein AidB-like acyl-CoA dehydrogenase